MVTQEVEILSPIQTFWLMTLDVVILNWNGRKLLEILLPRVAERSAVKGVTLVLADNGSDDDSVEWVKTNMPDVKIIELGQNYGFADGYNRLWPYWKATIVCYLILMWSLQKTGYHHLSGLWMGILK